MKKNGILNSDISRVLSFPQKNLEHRAECQPTKK